MVGFVLRAENSSGQQIHAELVREGGHGYAATVKKSCAGEPDRASSRPFFPIMRPFHSFFSRLAAMFRLHDITDGKKCARHSQKRADSFCRSCKEHFCIECLIEAGGYYYCGGPTCGGSAEALKAKVTKEIDGEHSKLFCAVCLAATEPELPRSTTTVGGFGTRMQSGRDTCPVCRSVDATEWGCLLHVPVFALAKYRMHWIDPTHYVGRKLKAQRAAAA